MPQQGRLPVPNYIVISVAFSIAYAKAMCLLLSYLQMCVNKKFGHLSIVEQRSVEGLFALSQQPWMTEYGYLKVLLNVRQDLPQNFRII